MKMDNEVFLVESIIAFTGHSHHYIVVAKDKEEAEEFVKEGYRHNPIGGDMSGSVILVTEMIDRSKKGILMMEEE